MKKRSIKILLALVVLLIGFVFWASSLFHSIPVGISSPEAEAVAQRMLRSVDFEAYKKVKSISWTFRGKSHHQWNKMEGTDKVRWESYEVWLNFKNGKHVVKKGGQEFPNDQLIEQAIAHFYNDSFWLLAPFKIMDEGTERKLVEVGEQVGLLVTYKSGGVTPGDSYLWILDENYRPKAWRLWTSNVSIKGMEFEWSDWQQHAGAWFAPIHPGPGPLSIDITNLVIE